MAAILSDAFDGWIQVDLENESPENGSVFVTRFAVFQFLRGVQLESMSDFIAIDIGNQNMMVARWNSKAHNELGNDISFVYSDYHEKKIPYDYAERVTN